MMDVNEVYAELEAAVKRAGSAKNFASQCGISTAYLSDIRGHRRDIGGAVLKQLGIKRIVTYTRQRGGA